MVLVGIELFPAQAREREERAAHMDEALGKTKAMRRRVGRRGRGAVSGVDYQCAG